MTTADDQYLAIIERILSHGYHDQNRTGMPATKLPHQIMQFDLAHDLPILTTKFVPFKTAVQELLWIYQKKSNSIEELHRMNVHIWDEWAQEDGTIGTSYGWIVEKYHLVDDLIRQLKENPQNRRMVMSLWQNDYLEGGSLYPCAFMTLWDVTDGRLNMMLVQRSADFPLGVPFNMIQYAVLQHLIAQVTGFQPGLFTHVINNAHIYDNQQEGMQTQLSRREEAKPAPTLWINPDIRDFYDFTIEDIVLENYEHLGKIPMEVSV
ncbi:Thymidylate synthase [Clostridiaceae bacterium JG1575]|nr:Thymidylate synthase [Clostridiaceae bacterium JG1575]